MFWCSGCDVLHDNGRQVLVDATGKGLKVSILEKGSFSGGCEKVVEELVFGKEGLEMRSVDLKAGKLGSLPGVKGLLEWQREGHCGALDVGPRDGISDGSSEAYKEGRNC